MSRIHALNNQGESVIDRRGVLIKQPLVTPREVEKCGGVKEEEISECKKPQRAGKQNIQSRGDALAMCNTG